LHLRNGNAHTIVRSVQQSTIGVSGTMTLTIPKKVGQGISGILNVVANNGGTGGTSRTYAINDIRGTTSVTQLSTANGSDGPSSFTITTDGNGAITFTNDSGIANANAAMTFIGTSY